MDEEKHAIAALGELGTGAAAKELYVDLLRPAAKEVGAGLGLVARMITHALTPLEVVVVGLDRTREWLAPRLLKRLARAAPEDVVEPPLHIAGPLLLAAPFAADDEVLRECYAGLLASSMHVEAQGRVHSSFVGILQQLDPAEALVLKRIGDAASTWELRDIFDAGIGEEKGENIELQFMNFCREAGVARPAMSEVYLENLLRLRLLKVTQYTEAEHIPSGHDDRFGVYPASVSTMGYRDLAVSALGISFIQAVVLEWPNS